MSFSRHLLSSVLIGGTVFAAATLPLATLSTKPVAIQMEGKPVFTGQFKELAGPYLTLALALSIGAGATHLSVMRWYRTWRDLESTQKQLTALRQQLHEKEALVESLRFAPSRLQANGLEKFLSEEAAVRASLPLGENLRNGSDPQVQFKPSA